jgi:hypothetical protein
VLSHEKNETKKSHATVPLRHEQRVGLQSGVCYNISMISLMTMGPEISEISFVFTMIVILLMSVVSTLIIMSAMPAVSMTTVVSATKSTD